MQEAQQKMGLTEAATAGAVGADEPRSPVCRIAAHCWALLLARIYGSDQAMLVRWKGGRRYLRKFGKSSSG